MSIIKEGYYRFLDNIDSILTTLGGISESNISCYLQDVEAQQWGMSSEFVGSSYNLEVGGYLIYENSAWIDNKYKKIFIPTEYDVGSDCYTLLNSAWVTYNFTLTFNTNGGSALTPVTEIRYIPNLPSPTKSGYIFDGWYYDNNTFLLPVNYGDEFTNDITIYAKWRNTYTVTFNANGGTTPSPLVNVQTITSYPFSSRSGYKFLGWFYDDSTFTLPVHVGDVVSNDITVYAKWRQTYTLTYNTMGGSAIAPSPNVTNIPSIIPIPTKTNYTFLGWYYESDYRNSVESGDPLTANTTIYARWVEEGTISLTLFNSIAEKKKVDKTNELTNSNVIYGYLRKGTSITNPIIEVELNSFPNYNYAFISTFKRYYFITDIIVLRTNLYQINLKVDVLMSFQTVLKDREVIVDRQEFNFNDYLVDDKVPCETKPIIEVFDITTKAVIRSDTEVTDNYVLELGGEIND